jgi:hypothetical protein
MLRMMEKRNRRDLEAFRDAVEADFAEHQGVRSGMAGAITAESISEAAAASLRS